MVEKYEYLLDVASMKYSGTQNDGPEVASMKYSGTLNGGEVCTGSRTECFVVL